MPVPYGKKVDITRVLNELAERNRYPISCMADITWRCNFRCRHCYQAKRRGKEITTRQWERVLDDLASTGVLLFTFSGGEPLLRKDFFKIARAARKRRFSLKLKTNAFLLDKKVADFLKEIGFEQVQISFYSIRPEVHDYVTGVKGSFERLMRATRLLKERGVDVHFSMPVMELNADDISRMVALARKLGCDYAVDPSLTICDDGSCSPAKMRARTDQLVKIFRNPRLLSSVAYKRDVRIRSRRKDDVVCNVGRASFVIDPSGEVRACAMLPMPIGDITKKTLKEIWDSSETLKLVRNITWNDLHGCSECELRPWCVRCHGSALIEDGDLLGPSSIACEVTKARKLAVESR